jgi:hypothetical protein
LPSTSILAPSGLAPSGSHHNHWTVGHHTSLRISCRQENWSILIQSSFPRQHAGKLWIITTSVSIKTLVLVQMRPTWFLSNQNPIFLSFFSFTITSKAQLLKPPNLRYLPPKMGSMIPNLETMTRSG